MTPTITPHSSMQSTTGRIAAVATALLLVVFLVLSVSRAAFTASTDNAGNSVETGTVTLTDNDAGTALFSIAAAQPGVETVQCIHVRYAGEFTSGDIKMFATPTAPATAIGDLAPYLNVKIERQELPNTEIVDDPTHSCVAFDAADLLDVLGAPAVIHDDTLATFPSDYATSSTAFTADESTHAFKVTISVENDPSAAGTTADWDFVWETQSA